MEERKRRILAFMKEDYYTPLLFDELVAVLDVPKTDVEMFRALLDELEREGKIFKTYKNRYGVPEKMGIVSGRLQGSEKGFGFVVPDDGSFKDIFIPADCMNGAMHNDRVLARVNKKQTHRKSAEGEIIKIIERANRMVVGTFENGRYFGFVVPDDRRIFTDVFIPKDEINSAKSGDKVVVEIIKWPDKRRSPEGKIVEVLGGKNETGTDILAVIRTYDLREDFPGAVIEQADAIPDTVTEDAIAGRRDLRGIRMVTIDGEDAKDLDDAVSVEKLPSGKYRLGVHIADVSHYVTEGLPLDNEALKRGTSIYLIDRVIPMLPQKLSNGICSLNPGVDRLALSVMMDIDHLGNVVDHEIFESVININERMTYTNVYKILVENDEALKERYEYLLDDFKNMEDLALILNQKRMSRGSIDFDFDEAKVILDDKGKPIEIKRYELTIANKIIEEFMLVCNETVAEHFYWTGIPFIYRVHEEPEIDKMKAFAKFAGNLGYYIKGINKIHSGALQDLLERVKGTKEELIISTVMLRSLARARYCHQSQGHFALATRYYCHFTAPIRRYPDLIIHRIIKEYINGRMDLKREEELEEKLPEIARLCSERERVAEEAEREIENMKKVEFMKEREGEIFEGVISNVTSFGMFVELQNTVEGLVKMNSLDDDYYIYDEKHYRLIGERTGKIYRIGDKVRVQVARVDVEARQIEFVIEETDDALDEPRESDGPGEERMAKGGRARKKLKKRDIRERALIKKARREKRSKKNGKGKKTKRGDN